MKNPKTQPVVATGQPPNTPHRAKPWPEYRTPATPVVGCAGSLGLPLTGLALDRHKQQRGRGGYGASRGYAEAVYNQQRVDDHNCNKNGLRPKARMLEPRRFGVVAGHGRRRGAAENKRGPCTLSRQICEGLPPHMSHNMGPEHVPLLCEGLPPHMSHNMGPEHVPLLSSMDA